METPGLGRGRFLGDCDVCTLDWGCEVASSLGCDGALGLECNEVKCFIVPTLDWNGVPGFIGGTCVSEIMGTRVPGFW